MTKGATLLNLVLVLVHLDHAASFTVNANHSIMAARVLRQSDNGTHRQKAVQNCEMIAGQHYGLLTYSIPTAARAQPVAIIQKRQVDSQRHASAVLRAQRWRSE